MKVFILGYAGNMGARYRSILHHLGHSWNGFDIYFDEIFPDGSPPSDMRTSLKYCDAAIIATHTRGHLDSLKLLKNYDFKKPILCEKPVKVLRSRENLHDFKAELKQFEDYGMQLSMVSQYDYFAPRYSPGGLTTYDYYRSGGDGLAWDCINVIWHATEKVKLEKKSPIWKCSLNDYPLMQSEMDYAYIDMIEKWLANPVSDYQRIIKAHEKVLDYLDGKFD